MKSKMMVSKGEFLNWHVMQMKLQKKNWRIFVYKEIGTRNQFRFYLFYMN